MKMLLKRLFIILLVVIVGGFLWCSHRQEQQAERQHQLNQALIVALNRHEAQTVKFLLGGGADVNARSDDPIVWSVWVVHFRHSPNEVFNGGTPPLAEAAVSSPNLVPLLLAHGADVNGRDAQGNTVLATAIGQGDKDLVKMLLEHGANARDKDSTGNPLVVSAVLSGSDDIVRMLLDKGASAKSLSAGGWPALSVAANKGDLQMVRLLLAHGADPNARGRRFGMRPLMAAAMNDNVEMVKLLLAQGASVYPSDMAG